jgi:hypothetical protein
MAEGRTGWAQQSRRYMSDFWTKADVQDRLFTVSKGREPVARS